MGRETITIEVDRMTAEKTEDDDVKKTEIIIVAEEVKENIDENINIDAPKEKNGKERNGEEKALVKTKETKNRWRNIVTRWSTTEMKTP